MTTAKAIKAFVAPLLSRHPEMVLVGRAVVLKPVNHLLHSIFIDRTSSANVCQPHWGVSEMWVQYDSMPIGHGDRLLGLWNLSQPELPQSLIKDVEEIALPKFQAVKTIRDYVALAMPTEADRTQFVVSYVRHLLVLGELDEARSILNTNERAKQQWLDRLDQIGIKDRLMDLGNDLGAADRTKLAEFFHSLKAYSVEKLKIGHLWQRTPFPLEEGALA